MAIDRAVHYSIMPLLTCDRASVHLCLNMGGCLNHYLMKEITYTTLLYYTSCNGEFEVTHVCNQINFLILMFYMSLWYGYLTITMLVFRGYQINFKIVTYLLNPKTDYIHITISKWHIKHKYYDCIHEYNKIYFSITWSVVHYIRVVHVISFVRWWLKQPPIYIQRHSHV